MPSTTWRRSWACEPSPHTPRNLTAEPLPQPTRLRAGALRRAVRLPSTTPDPAIGDLLARLGWEPRDEELVSQSLAHRSWCAEHPGAQSNERLEFLGDSVLGLVVTEHIYRTYPELPEGELAKVRASVVNSASLAEVAVELRLGEALLLGKGEDASGGREKPSILADAMESVIGALYLDQGWGSAAELVMRLLDDRIAEAAVGPGGQDYKTRLQELCARRFDHLPTYLVRDAGPDHAKTFDAVVHVADQPMGQGWGRSKKQAEQAAARAAWMELVGEGGLDEPDEGSGEAPAAPLGAHGSGDPDPAGR